MRTSRFITLFLLLFLAIASHAARACPACYDPAGNEKMNNAASIGIATMVVIMFVMLGSLIGIARHFAWRAKNPLPDYDELLAEDPKPGDSNPKS